MRPERQDPPAANRGAEDVTGGDITMVPLTGCPDGCLDGEPCVTDRPAPTRSQFCGCSGLGIETLRQPWALRWHLSGHPDFADVAA